MNGTRNAAAGALPWAAGLALLLGGAVALAFWGTASFAQAPPSAAAPTTLPADAVKTIAPGRGEIPAHTDTVSVRYVGKLTDGTVFDASPPGQTVDFPLDGVVPGFSQGIQRMHVGERARITIPPALGYPDGTPDGKIPPGSTIMFEVELVKIVKAQ